MHAILSIHDVMPHTLDKVRAIIGCLDSKLRDNLILLVVPGQDWTPQQLKQLQQYQDAGICLAGHGWQHQSQDIRSFYHHLHALLLSRQAAEHLSLTEAEIFQLIQRCFQWFVEKQFKPPDLYVPPAWALGRISMQKLKQTSFRYFENTTGFIDAVKGKKKTLPLIGFEADTSLRKFSLIVSNSLNTALANTRRPLRISIHPDDYELKLAGKINHLLKRVSVSRTYAELF